ncbi:MFS transporter [Flagellimonas taeanensis]|uniref:Fucose permease n=1 Tax=Flagellimonas taeanensis TaxID=1005926 RepID=A0A1M6XX72_9FLAO|nr:MULTISPECIES: MFS transporter [Allomuricauda]MDC6383758.1 MFS transporter [Muricauda sp. SK9]MEE1961771.1 MFS transporter [Allomuricauda taeanensis]RIV48758.1 MFS transporter [Allomuricauda taeanensis]SFC03753.1 Fucose permease [Allomuricauda taeanensis]SHL10469.1 Fucose permease [Allomuricauda taeanensis]
MKNVNKNQLFLAACISLVVTSMTFAIRAGILTQLGEEFGISNQQLGWINSMAFLGFPLAMILGGLLYNKVGARKLMVAAFVCHLLGLVLTIVAGGFWTLIISTFFIGFANGSVEAACNPMIADMYTKNRTAMLNKFHVWFPGGIVIGSLISKFMTDFGMGWQLQIGIMLIPTFIYGYMFFKQEFPESEHIETDTAKNIKSLADPLFIFILACMTLTAISEFGPQQWVERILGNSGASPMLILAMVTGIMAIGRYFAGPIVHRLNPIGVLLLSALITTAAVYSMSIAEGSMIYLAAVLFALGVCYFWPTMIGFTSEYLPKTGALGMSLVGGAGMFATSIWQPVIGGWLDSAKETAVASGLTDQVAELTAGKATLGKMMFFPLAVAILFAILFLFRKKLEERRVPQGHASEEIV